MQRSSVVAVGVAGLLWVSGLAMAADAPKNLIDDPSFETVAEGKSLPEKWHPSGETPQVLVDQDSTVAHSGIRSLHVKFKDVKEPQYTVPIIYRNFGKILEPGKTYTLSCYVKTAEMKGTTLLYLYQYPAPFGPEHQATSKELTGTNDWTLLTITFKARAEFEDLQVRFVTACPANAFGGDVWFDDLTIVEGDKPLETPASPAK